MSERVKIVPLGVGGAFSKKFYHNNYVFEIGDRKILVDAGTTLRYSLSEAGYDVKDITDVIITHFHSDHVGGLEEFAQRCYWRPDRHKPNLFVLYGQDNQFDMALKEGLYTDGLDLDDYFNLVLCSGSYEIAEGLYLRFISTTGLHIPGMRSYAIHLYNVKNGKNLLFSSDIKDLESSTFNHLINDDTLAIFQDCQLIHVEKKPVHAELPEIEKYYDVKNWAKIHVMHYGDNIEDHRASIELLGMTVVEQGSKYEFEGL